MPLLLMLKQQKAFLNEELQVPDTKIRVIFPTISAEVQPLEWGEKQLYKLQYTNAKEFFLLSRNFRDMDEIVFMLKAFSVFKKMAAQQHETDDCWKVMDGRKRLAGKIVKL